MLIPTRPGYNAVMLTISLALAADPPPRPAPPAATPGECTRNIPVPVGPLPPELGKCAGVLVPTSDLADLLQIEVYAEHVADLYAVDTAALEAQLAAERERAEWYRVQAARPKVEPAVWVGVGVVGGVGVTLAAAWGMGQVAP